MSIKLRDAYWSIIKLNGDNWREVVETHPYDVQYPFSYYGYLPDVEITEELNDRHIKIATLHVVLACEQDMLKLVEQHHDYFLTKSYKPACMNYST
jgi:hypothetical protein